MHQSHAHCSVLSQRLAVCPSVPSTVRSQVIGLGSPTPGLHHPSAQRVVHQHPLQGRGDLGHIERVDNRAAPSPISRMAPTLEVTTGSPAPSPREPATQSPHKAPRGARPRTDGTTPWRSDCEILPRRADTVAESEPLRPMGEPMIGANSTHQHQLTRERRLGGQGERPAGSRPGSCEACRWRPPEHSGGWRPYRSLTSFETRRPDGRPSASSTPLGTTSTRAGSAPKRLTRSRREVRDTVITRRDLRSAARNMNLHVQQRQKRDLAAADRRAGSRRAP